MVPQISDRPRNAQVTPIVGLPMPIVTQINHGDQQNVHFDNESLM